MSQQVEIQVAFLVLPDYTQILWKDTNSSAFASTCARQMAQQENLNLHVCRCSSFERYEL